MSASQQELPGINTPLDDHDASGVEILVAEPSRYMRLTILAIFLMIVAGAVWSFIGKANVIVKTNGILAPEGEVKRVYAPIEGEIVDNYMLEGSPVVKGDVLARINSPGAIQLATRTADAKIALKIAEAKSSLYPETKKVTEAKEDMLKFQIESEQALQDKRYQEDMAKLLEEHQLKLEKIQAQLDQARRAMEVARSDWQKHVRLRGTPGEGGISEQKVVEKRNAYLSKRTDFQLKQTELSEFEIKFKEEKLKKFEEIQKKSEVLRNLKVQLGETIVRARQTELDVTAGLRKAKAALRSAQRIDFEDIDADSFLLIRAPVSGVLSSVSTTQVGDKVEGKKPIAGIAPENAPLIMELEIPERNRAFLKEGMPVRIKLNAFPYQRYGTVEGTLKFIAPTASVSARDKKQIVFKAKATLAKDYVEVNNVRYPFRYGMLGTAEITVRKRRLIDMALDPFRNVAG